MTLPRRSDRLSLRNQPFFFVSAEPKQEQRHVLERRYGQHNADGTALDFRHALATGAVRRVLSWIYMT